MTIRLVALSLAVAGVSGCAARQTPVPLEGRQGDVRALGGEWSGDYWSSETGRTGSISFTLAAQGDTAFGNVIMIPAGMNEPLRAWRDEAVAPARRPQPEVLTISFVRVTGNEVSGSLEPYQDPVCGCALYTRFIGRVTGDTIAGTYISQHERSSSEAHGSWKVTRRGS